MFKFFHGNLSLPLDVQVPGDSVLFIVELVLWSQQSEVGFYF